MGLAFIALGSNLGDRYGTLQAAVSRLRAEPGSRLLAVSNWIETQPVNCPPDSQSFLNGCALIETNKKPGELLAWLLQVEETFGRKRTIPNSPRTLDLDLLLYDDLILEEKNSTLNLPLTLPHPRLHERAFVLQPLAEIAADHLHPVLKKTIGELARQFPLQNVYQHQAAQQTFANQNVLVTGSTSGIGLEIAKAFASHNANVFTHGRRSDQLTTQHSNTPGHRHFIADLSDEQSTHDFARKACQEIGSGAAGGGAAGGGAAGGGGIDVLILAAGADILTGDGPKQSFEQKLNALWAVDVRSTMIISRAIGQQMKARKKGVIITIGWDQAEHGFVGDSGQLFTAIKGAVQCFSRSLAIDLSPDVRVNCIAPGWIRTAWGETASETWQDRVRRETPLQRWGLPGDIANAALWLANPQSAFITGQTLNVNGGVVRR